MPGVPIVVPVVVPDWPIDIFGPSLSSTAAVGATFDTSGYTKYQAPSTTAAIWGANSGAATRNMGLYHGLYGWQYTSTVANFSDAASVVAMYVPITKDAVPVLFKYPVATRCFIVSFAMCFPVAALYNDLSGICIEPAAGAAPGWIRGAQGFGIVGDGAGGVRWVSKVAGSGVGVYAESIPLALGAAITEWFNVDIQILAANGNANGNVTLFINGVQQFAPRSWGPGTVLTDYTQPANAVKFVAHCRCGDALVGQMNVSAFRWRIGAYDINGAAV